MEKVKIVKNVLDKKVFAVAYLLLFLYDNFYKQKSDNNISVKLAKPQLHVASHILGGKIGSSNWMGLKSILHLIF